MRYLLIVLLNKPKRTNTENYLNIRPRMRAPNKVREIKTA
jgi:hypothetical protein